MLRIAVCLAALAALVSASCADVVGPGLVTGEWRGDGVRLVATATGTDLSYSCGTGHIDQPLVIDRKGRFSGTGTETRFVLPPAVGPVLRAAEYTIRISGHRLSLSVSYGTFSSESGRSYELKAGADVLIPSCLTVSLLRLADHRSARPGRP